MTAKYNKKVQNISIFASKGREGNSMKKNSIKTNVVFWEKRENIVFLLTTDNYSGGRGACFQYMCYQWNLTTNFRWCSNRLDCKRPVFTKLSLSLTELRCLGWARGRAEMARMETVIDIRTDGILNLASVCIKGENKGDINIVCYWQSIQASLLPQTVWDGAGLLK